MKASNCRKIYADYFKIQVKEGYHIHHIDFNPENNDIGNLLLLPDDLHRSLHRVKKEYGGFLDGQMNVFIDIKNQLTCSIMAEAMQKIPEIYDEIQIWVSIKEMEQLGIHNNYFNYNMFRK